MKDLRFSDLHQRFQNSNNSGLGVMRPLSFPTSCEASTLSGLETLNDLSIVNYENDKCKMLN